MNASLRVRIAKLEDIFGGAGVVEPVPVLIEGTGEFNAYRRDPSIHANTAPIIVRVMDARKESPVPA